MFDARTREVRNSSDPPYRPPYRRISPKRHLIPFLHRSNKHRLYVMLFTHTSGDRYHWALATGPKDDSLHHGGARPQGHVYHVVSAYVVASDDDMTGVQETEPQDQPVPSGAPGVRGVARMVVGKIRYRETLKAVLAGAPRSQVDTGRNCRQWVANALREVAESGAMASSVDLTDWQPIEDYMMQSGRRREATGIWNAEAIATCDIMTRIWDI